MTVFFIILAVAGALGVISIIVEYVVHARRARQREREALKIFDAKICEHCGVEIMFPCVAKRATNGGWLCFDVCEEESRPNE